MGQSCIFDGIKAAALALVAATATATAQATDLPRVDLELFGREDIVGGVPGCYFAIWQHNRNPDTDRYAYVFFTDFSEDLATNPARIDIGGDVYRVDELVSGSVTKGGLATQHLFASGDREVRVHIEVNEASYADALTTIEDASVTVIQKGKVPFVLRGKGLHGCPERDPVQPAPSTPVVEPKIAPADQGVALKRRIEPKPVAVAASFPSGIPVGAPTDLAHSGQVPAGLQRVARELAGAECDLDTPAAWPGTRFVVNDFYILWQLPCFLGAYQGSSIIGVTENPPAAWADVLPVPQPAGSFGEQYGVMNAQIKPSQGIVTATEFGRGGGDCGTYSVFRLIDGPGEVLELELLEYRSKQDCDGKVTEPENWPLVERNY